MTHSDGMTGSRDLLLGTVDSPNARDVRRERDAECRLIWGRRIIGGLRVGLLLILDIAATFVAIGMLSALRGGPELWPPLAAPFIAATVVAVLAIIGGYRPGAASRPGLRTAAAIAMVGSVLLSLGAVRLPLPVADSFWVGAAGAILITVSAGRVLAGAVGRWRDGHRDALLIGDDEGASELRHHGGRSARARVRAWIDTGSPPGEASDGGIGQIESIIDRASIDVVLLAGSLPRPVFERVVDQTIRHGVRLEIIAGGTGNRRITLVPRFDGAAHAVEVRPSGWALPQMALKRAVDLVIAGLGLLLVSPLLLAIAAAIRLETPGPIIFRQQRVGLGGATFEMWKFRTMVADADRMKAAIAHMNESGDPRLFKVASDPRITRVGRWLRATSLDEIPQLFNVLRGEMSLVGPRPFFPEDLELYEPHHFERLSVLPGITGLWQVSGRSDVRDFETVVALDRDYIEQWSLRLDLAILVRTIPALLRKEGAY